MEPAMQKLAIIALLLCLAIFAGLSQQPQSHGRPPPRERPDSPGERAAYDAARRLPPGAEAIDPAWYARARAQAERMASFSTQAGRIVTGEKTAPAWQWLGPTNVGGRTRTLEFDPRNPARMLAGGVSGGVFESTNGGQYWQPLSDDTVNLNIGALAFDPVAPDTIYAGTGELYRNSERPYAAMWGQGILRSDDGGRHWRPLLATQTADFRYVSDLVVSVQDHRRLYAATNTGVWRSDDGGISFVQILRPTVDAGLQYEGCTDLQPLPGGEALLASCASRSEDDRYWLPGTVVPPACGGPCPASVFRTDDARGTPTWQLVLSEAGMGRTSLAIAPSNPQILYALSASIVDGPDRNGDGRGDYDNGLHALFRSDDGGRTWAARLRNSSSDVLSTYLLSYADGFEAVRCGFGNFDAYSAGWYNQALVVNPLDPEIVWVGGMEVYRSNDGGRSFGKASWWWLDDGQPGAIHADQHLLRFHPHYAQGMRILYSANDGGVAYTDNDAGPVRAGAAAACGPGSGALRWTTIENGLGSSQFYTGAVSATASRWLGGTQDNGTLLQDAGSPAGQFDHIFGGDGASVAIDPRNENTLYVSYQDVNIHRSIDGGPFVRATNGINDVTVFIMPFVLDALAPDRLYAGGSRLWRTRDQGRNWVAASASLGSGFLDRISAIGLSPVDNNRILLGNQRAIFRSASANSTTGATAFAAISPRSGWVSSLSFDPADANIAYATYSTFGGAHVWRSDDAGASWRAIDGVGEGALPDVPVHHLVIDPGNRSRLYIGTDLGVFVSLDGGQHWARENGGFANVIVERLAIASSPPSGAPELYAFTYGRGVWRAPLTSFDAVSSYTIGPDLSGSFYDPAQDGHGWFIEATNIGGVPGVVATWYTYLAGEPVWMVGAAPVDGDSARVPLSITRGGGFPPAFDPTAVVIEPWGEVLLRFSSRDAGTATWTTSRPGFANGGMPLRRLTAIGADTGGGLRACHSGTWYQPEQNGHGLQAQVIGPPGQQQLVLIWFVYLQGRQVWLIGVAPIQGEHARVPMTITRGGQFPPAFQAAQVVREPWGTVDFRAVDGGRARIEWQSDRAGFGSGGLDLVRLSGLLGKPCN
ncbi:MAG: hypothetical protein DYH17_06280 [Xanthomonadales bacterium PRO6]|nr:hypothetical protein [Xanthomonadales bacterium PRO6]